MSIFKSIKNYYINLRKRLSFWKKRKRRKLLFIDWRDDYAMELSDDWEEIGELFNDWFDNDSPPPIDEPDYEILCKARFFYDKYTHSYFFSHWGGSEDNYYFYSQDYLSAALERNEDDNELFELPSQFNFPLFQFSKVYAAECEGFSQLFYREFRIEAPWDFVDQDHLELAHEPHTITDSGGWDPTDNPQHNHEHSWHLIEDEEKYYINKYDSEDDGEGMVVPHWTRDEYDWDTEIPTWIVDEEYSRILFPYERMRKKWTSYTPIAKKHKFGYNLDLYINYSLRDYYGFLAFDDDLNISVHLARRYGWHDNPTFFEPTLIYAQRNLDEVLDPLVIEGLLVPYFHDWAPPVDEEVKLYQQLRNRILSFQAWKRWEKRWGNRAKKVKLYYLQTKFAWHMKYYRLRQKIRRAGLLTFLWTKFKIALLRLIKWIILMTLWIIKLLLSYAWATIWSFGFTYCFAGFLHYCVDHEIITIRMKYTIPQEIGLPWLYPAILFHLFVIVFVATNYGISGLKTNPKKLSEWEDYVRTREFNEEQQAEMDRVGGYMKWRYNMSRYQRELFTHEGRRERIFMGFYIVIFLFFFWRVNGY